MSKYYAVKKGVKPGIYRTWPECQRQVSGFSGAVYKSFQTLREAQAWLAGNQETSRRPPHHFEQTSLSLEQAEEETAFNYPNTIELYTDGGSRNHGNKLGQHVKQSDKAAWAYLIIRDGKKYPGTGGEFGATNNRMELMAFRNALRLMLKNNWHWEPINATLDSHYVLDPITKGWLYGWQRRGWRTSTGSAVANQELWQEVLRLLPEFKHLKFQWTKGHADNAGNVIVDHLLNETMDKMEEE